MSSRPRPEIDGRRTEVCIHISYHTSSVEFMLCLCHWHDFVRLAYSTADAFAAQVRNRCYNVPFQANLRERAVPLPCFYHALTVLMSQAGMADLERLCENMTSSSPAFAMLLSSSVLLHNAGSCTSLASASKRARDQIHLQDAAAK